MYGSNVREILFTVDPQETRKMITSLMDGLSPEIVERLGGKVRCVTMLTVCVHAAILCKSGCGNFGHCVDEAAKVADITLTERERGDCLLAATRLAMLSHERVTR